MKKKNIGILGTDEFNFIKLKSLRRADEFEYHHLLDYDEFRGSEEYNIDELLYKAEERINAIDGQIDAIVGYFDFPVTDMLPILRKRFGLVTPSLESVMKCEHKYWSRLIQKKVVPQNIPGFSIFDPFRDDALEQIGMEFPFWIKPVKSFKSYLGFRINNEEEFNHAIETIREHIEYISKPFDKLLDHLDMPTEVDEVGGVNCLAEEIITGKQCTLEGYMINGKVHTYGIVDSYRDINRSSFSRYEYPSTLPYRVQDEMVEIADKVMSEIGMEPATFNMEFFYNESEDHIQLLEINPRISQSHGDLFQKVDGTANHEIMIDIALNEEPQVLHREGLFNHAAKFMMRRFADGIVTRVPNEEDLEVIRHRYPGALIEVHVQEGQQLSELLNQDSYSFELADIYMGAGTQKNLLSNHEGLTNMLPFHFEDVAVHADE